MTLCTVDGCDNPVKARGWCRTHYLRWYQYGTLETRKRYATCTVDGCDRQADRVTIGLCEAHYMQKRRNGQITSVEVKERHGGPGNPVPVAQCKESECERNASIRGWCIMHYTRWMRHGDPQKRLPTIAELPKLMGTDHASWRGDSAGYTAVHDRIRVRRGSASAHNCQRCEKTARQWAYDHGDPNERVDAKYGPYSTDPERYIPLCVPCHKRFDLNYLALAKEGRNGAQDQ